MQRSRPFARAIAMMALVASMGAPAAIAQAGEYKSRGKGLGRYSGKGYGNSGTRFPQRADQFRPETSRACARRRRQIEKGMIHASA